MEQIVRTEKSLKDPIGIEHFKELLFVLDTLFDEDYSLKSGKPYKKAKLTFDKMIESKWEIQHFRDVLNKFTKQHPKKTWMPYDFFTIWYEV